MAGVLYELDSVVLLAPYVEVVGTSRRGAVQRRDSARATTVVHGVRTVSATQALIDLAKQQDDLTWEQTLESALRKKLVSIRDLEIAASESSASVSKRIKGVLALRPLGAPPTESLLETLAVQLIRKNPDIPTPTRQVEVRTPSDRFVARVDLAWPDLGLFVELYGSQHGEQWVYDAHRETDIIAITGWLFGRFTWRDITKTPTESLRRIGRLIEQARARNSA